eukprot:4242817-Alexandrium_andersonii.AAC.1
MPTQSVRPQPVLALSQLVWSFPPAGLRSEVLGVFMVLGVPACAMNVSNCLRVCATEDMSVEGF